MATSQSTAFGALLRRHRLLAGLTQEQLAERAGLSARAINALERGVNRAPQCDTFRLLAEARELGPDERAALEATTHRPRMRTPQVLGGIKFQQGDQPVRTPLVGRAQEMARATEIAAQSIARARTQAYQLALADALRVGAIVQFGQRCWRQAQALLDEALRVAREMAYPDGVAKALYVAGQLHDASGEPEQARAFHRAAGRPRTTGRTPLRGAHRAGDNRSR